jgi:hypothetical protein
MLVAAVAQDVYGDAGVALLALTNRVTANAWEFSARIQMTHLQQLAFTKFRLGDHSNTSQNCP